MSEILGGLVDARVFPRQQHQQPQAAFYKDEVLGRYVAVQFQLENGQIKPYVGKITKVQISLRSDHHTRQYEHYVVFDDGDEFWYDLVEQESLQRLTWIATPTGGAFPNNNRSSPIKTKKRTRPAKRGRPKIRRPARPAAAAIEASEDDNDDDTEFCWAVPPTPPSRATRKKSFTTDVAKVTPEKTCADSYTNTPKHNKAKKQRPPTLPTRAKFGGKTPRGFLSASTVTPGNSQETEHRDNDETDSEEGEEINVQEDGEPNRDVGDDYDEEQDQDDPRHQPSTWPIDTTNHKIRSNLDQNNVALTEERLQGFFRWMIEVPHGTKLTTVTESNAKRVLQKVRLLASGDGIPYKNHWPSHVYFYKGQPVDLKFDFDQMMDHAIQYLAAYGDDLGHGWLLKHPITKLKLYQEFLLGTATTTSHRNQSE